MTELPPTMRRRLDAAAAQRRDERLSLCRARALYDAIAAGQRLLWPSGVPWLGSGLSAPLRRATGSGLGTEPEAEKSAYDGATALTASE